MTRRSQRHLRALYGKDSSGYSLARELQYNAGLTTQAQRNAAEAAFAGNRLTYPTAPTVAAVIPTQTATAGAAWSFAFAAGTFTDADSGDVLTYTARLANGLALPSWMTFTSATRTFSGTVPVTLRSSQRSIGIVVTATDKGGNPCDTTFVLNVTQSAPSIGTAFVAQTATQAVAFTYTFTAFTDTTTGDVVSYQASQSDGTALPAWLSFNPSTRTFSGTPAARDVGVSTIMVVGTDLGGNSVSGTFTLTVS